VQLTAQYRKGLMDVEDASAAVLPLIRKEKKADRIIAANSGKSLEELASSNNTNQSTATALTVKTPTIPGAGREPLVVGKAFSLEQGETSGLIEGESGIFMVHVTKKEEAPKLDNYATYATSLRTSNAARVNTEVFNALKDKATIEDNRSVFY
jgi:peptidyl-prolyl cis-trans isomerase D